MLVNRASGAVTQRIASVEHAVTPEFQAWLRELNAQKFEAYFSANTLHLGARGRTKADIQEIRHLYLDFDDDGARRVASLASHSLPKPNFVIHSSQNRNQVFWVVVNFDKPAAEALMRHLAREIGADLAATDCTRVMRLPGLYNHKYGSPQYVRIDYSAGQVYSPEHFPQFNADERTTRNPTPAPSPHGKMSQSERDFGYAIRALRRGEDPSEISSAIARYRLSEKSDPGAYADRTVRRAAESLATEEVQEPTR
ncbi:MAG: DNA-primase RepB domain-containing protein [Acidobacteria bacterium]|nr:DNA-primase RepB domain-containing protein [Acidobacteriota bacterium]